MADELTPEQRAYREYTQQWAAYNASNSYDSWRGVQESKPTEKNPEVATASSAAVPAQSYSAVVKSQRDKLSASVSAAPWKVTSTKTAIAPPASLITKPRSKLVFSSAKKNNLGNAVKALAGVANRTFDLIPEAPAPSYMSPKERVVQEHKEYFSKTPTVVTLNPTTYYSSVPSPATPILVKTAVRQQVAGEWPPSLKAFVARAFKNCDAEVRPGIERELKELIFEATANNKLWITDWANHKIPDGKSNIKPIPVPTVQYVQPIQESPLTMPKRKFIDSPIPIQSGGKKGAKLAKQQANSLPKKKKAGIVLLEDMQDNEDDDSDLQLLAPALRDAELARRQRRRKRFTEQEKIRKDAETRDRKDAARQKASFIARGQEGNPDVIDWDKETIIGSCTKLTKPYLRLTSAPDPTTVRPLNILKKSLDYLIGEWQSVAKDEQDYPYICSQFKSLRQDLTVQRIKSAFTATVYETHARIALDKKDVGEYNQCQVVLMDLYNRHSIAGCHDEFVAYRILYTMHTYNQPDLVKMLKTVETRTKGPAVQHALNVAKSVCEGTYPELFRLYQSAPNLSSHLMDTFVYRARIDTFRKLCKSYRPSLHVRFVWERCGFDRSTNLAVIRKWVAEIGVDVDGEGYFDCKRSLVVLASKLAEIGKGVDLKGQI